MDEDVVEEFNERFANIEETLKYIADSQARHEFIHKRDMAEIRASQDRTQKHLEHITKVLRFNIEEYEFQEDKLPKQEKF